MPVEGTRLALAAAIAFTCSVRAYHGCFSPSTSSFVTTPSLTSSASTARCAGAAQPGQVQYFERSSRLAAPMASSERSRRCRIASASGNGAVASNSGSTRSMAANFLWKWVREWTAMRPAFCR